MYLQTSQFLSLSSDFFGVWVLTQTTRTLNATLCNGSHMPLSKRKQQLANISRGRAPDGTFRDLASDEKRKNTARAERHQRQAERSSHKTQLAAEARREEQRREQVIQDQQYQHFLQLAGAAAVRGCARAGITKPTLYLIEERLATSQNLRQARKELTQTKDSLDKTDRAKTVFVEKHNDLKKKRKLERQLYLTKVGELEAALASLQSKIDSPEFRLEVYLFPVFPCMHVTGCARSCDWHCVRTGWSEVSSGTQGNFLLNVFYAQELKENFVDFARHCSSARASHPAALAFLKSIGVTDVNMPSQFLRLSSRYHLSDLYALRLSGRRGCGWPRFLAGTHSWTTLLPEW